MEDRISQTQEEEVGGAEEVGVNNPQPKKPKKKTDFWVRLGVGVLYMAVLIGFFFRKRFFVRFYRACVCDSRNV